MVPRWIRGEESVELLQPLAASGTITQLVPPSLVLVVLADQLGRSVGDMYKGAWGPSILQVLLFALYTFLLSRVRPDFVPGVPKEARTLSGPALVIKCLRGIIPSFVLIFAVLGSMGGLPGINTAICTPTEAGAMGAVGAFILAAMHGRLKWELVRGAMEGTMRITAMVVFILIGSRVFSLVFQGVDGAIWIEHMLLSATGGTQVGLSLSSTNTCTMQSLAWFSSNVSDTSPAGTSTSYTRNTTRIVSFTSSQQNLTWS